MIEQSSTSELTTETQRHRESAKNKERFIDFYYFPLSSPCLCVSVVIACIPLSEVSI